MTISPLRQNLVITKVSLHSPKQDSQYWRSQSYVSRLAALEEIRCEFHQWKYDVQPRFQRVYTVVKRESNSGEC